MIISDVKKFLAAIGINPRKLNNVIAQWSIARALKEKGYDELIDKLRSIEPDLSEQYSSGKEKYNEYLELKRRALHSFQCSLMLKVVKGFDAAEFTVVDIGDSAGTHMRYLQELTKGKHKIDTISVNLDPRAITKIKAKGQKAILCRAEDLSSEMGQPVDLFICFETIEHLHNPALFFHRLAKKSDCNKMLMTVPYVRNSRVGLHHLRRKTENIIFAEAVHIFELNPEDWTLLILHSGWKVVYSEIYYQYPTKWPSLIRWLLRKYWRMTDCEGFWGAVLEKEKTYAELYQDWED